MVMVKCPRCNEEIELKLTEEDFRFRYAQSQFEDDGFQGLLKWLKDKLVAR